MMTLYVVFQAVENGEISLDKKVKISRHAASEPPSKLGLKSGERVRLRFLIRAAAIKSANDAATALGEAIEGSEAAFARRMNRTAKAMGMSRTVFKNAHGLTESGHLSTANDMTILGRHLFYDFPDYYHLFARKTHSAGSTQVRNTNRRFLSHYRGADGIKTGYTRAAGYNLVASANRNGERIITTVFGGRSTPTRNAQVAKLMDLGFKIAPRHVKLQKPKIPSYRAITAKASPSTTVSKSLRPRIRPENNETQILVAANKYKSDILSAINQAQITGELVEQSSKVYTNVSYNSEPKPEYNIETVKYPRTISRLTSSGQKDWGIDIGTYPNRFKADSILIKTALSEMISLEGSLRKVVKNKYGFRATFLGLSENKAGQACKRLRNRNISCEIISPG
jgi:D-alanyl-D-alanine carboxypeptidase